MTVDLAQSLFDRVNEALRHPERGARAWLGLGLESVPGKPFGWAWEQERAALRARVMRRFRYGTRLDDAQRLYTFSRNGGVEHYITRVQERLHRNNPTYRHRQEAWLARSAQKRKTVAPEGFTREELERLADLFAEANDPITAGIGVKAVALLAALPNQE